MAGSANVKPVVAVVASSNPVKLLAAKKGLTAALGVDIEIISVNVDSGVPAQPMGSEQTLTGALLRAQRARDLKPDANYWLGLEAGVEPVKADLLSFSWVVILSHAQDGVGQARTAGFILPLEVSKLVRSGIELGTACDEVFHKISVKHKEGAVGCLTHGAIARVDLYTPAVHMAMMPFINPDLKWT